jgi:hypothetical protein
VSTGQVERVVDLIVREVLEARSVSLARAEPGIVEPELLRRAEGSSVYTVAGGRAVRLIKTYGPDTTLPPSGELRSFAHDVGREGDPTRRQDGDGRLSW